MSLIPLKFENRSFARFAAQTLLINFSAMTVVIIIMSLTGSVRQALSVKNLIGVFVYANCIGTLCSLVIAFGLTRLKNNSIFVRLILIIISIFLTTLIGITLGNLLLTLLGDYPVRRIFPPDAQNFIFSLIIALMFGVGTGLYEISKLKLLAAEVVLRRAEAEEANAQTLAAEARLASLESRIHPHFLFNTLNSIAALVREDAELAERTIEKLAALLRYSLDSNAVNLIPLAQELDVTEKYLEIEKVRFGKRLNYRINVESDAYGTELPPLALQTLVENSIKHVAAKRIALTEILIEVRRTELETIIEVTDNGAGFTEAALLKNHGLDNLRQRLKTIFGAAAKLEILEKESSAVRIYLPSAKV